MDLGSNSNVDVVDDSNTNDIIHVPKSNVRTRKDLTHKGWIKRRGGYGIFGGWKRQFLSLWRNTILYFHRDDASSREFYNGPKSKNNAKGEINLRNIVGVREASKGKIPGNSRGIELVSSSGKITTICPEGDRNVFMGWLNALRDIIGKLNLERYRRTRDREYRRDVSKVDPGRFGESTLDDIRSSVVDVDSYNVDVWDIDDSKSSGYNVDIFDDTDTVGDDPNRANTGINDLESSAYQKHVESRGAYALRGSGPPKTAHGNDDRKINVTVGYDEDGERKSDIIDTE